MGLGCRLHIRVFPTQVGVFLRKAIRRHNHSCLPHAGGGVSNKPATLHFVAESSPRRWGCFWKLFILDLIARVFPTQVGVFLLWALFYVPVPGLPHAGGGVSHYFNNRRSSDWSSPRRWGCFRNLLCLSNPKYVFPTQVGVFLMAAIFVLPFIRLPHAGGGVSIWNALKRQSEVSSPRRWGCFQQCVIQCESAVVFPTQVGVFLFCVSPKRCRLCLPHAGGGVSTSSITAAPCRVSSPRRWGCFSSLLICR
ncbi:conserved hypothetical protein [Vibrio cholerae O395]|uniref:Uncharacterized protein n=1 Tax=Vibrio cholerae serotype O1 (strain ATCC 39541 / Classical Ogawa 395 / O395) TaxID=345073 RepID=A0A0H3AK95_VIBC3|nr:conserved hypothetical protein [Vibrio cholerae O395]ACP08352.1 hypothetical protein VC395_0328a [Vibrio cholerae O395]